MSDSDLLRAIEAEMQAHRDALARLGRVKLALMRMVVTPAENGKVAEILYNQGNVESPQNTLVSVQRAGGDVC